MIKRGRYSRPFLHAATMVVLGLGVIIAPFIANTYPVFSQSIPNTIKDSSSQQSIVVGENVFHTQYSEKPRDEIVPYTVQKGDTISTIAQKYGVSVETIKWQNNLTYDEINVGEQLDILPVTGVSHKVQSGDTVYTIAKKFDTDPQKIVDFPFNDFANPETFSLVSGQILIVPDGIEPSEQPTYRRPVYIAQGPSAPRSSAGFAWPLSGPISQFAAWYHMAVDITAPVGTPIVSANSGVVSSVITGSWDGGYGNNVYVDGGNGYITHYAHLSGVNVSPGQSVVGGSTVVGWVGLTGRTTGSHLHFEILQNGSLVNPLSFLQ
jgi:murein DD-endopeptidase MepM/ murein hydrolase activator NlpD